MGLGVGAVRPGAPGQSGSIVAANTGLGAGKTRTMFQVEAAVSYLHRAHGSRSGAGVDVGLVYTQVAEESMPAVRAAGGFPYVRPRTQLGPLSLAIALAGFGMGGGGGGVYGGIADAQLGYVAPRWSIYSGLYSLVWDVTGGDRTVAKQLRAGGELHLRRGPEHLGVAFELYAQEDAFSDRSPGGIEQPGRTTRVESHFLGGALKLTVATGILE